MKILFDIGHPADVHFFKNAIWILESEDHEVQITARDKDVTFNLLNEYGFKYHNIGRNQKGFLKKAIGMIKVDYKLYKITKKFNPDVMIGFHSLYATHVCKILKKKSIIFADTEHAKIVNKLTFPFASLICVPSSYKLDPGPKQIRYNGCKELAYLHPNYFKPNPSVLNELGLEENDRFIILRFVAANALHDAKTKQISIEMQRSFVNELKNYGRVLITSESKISSEFEPYLLKLAPRKIHDLLWYATLYVGDSATMASEAALLGTPSIYFSSLAGTMGTLEELEIEYGLLKSFRNYPDVFDEIHKILSNKNSNEIWQNKRKRYLNEKIDVTKFGCVPDLLNRHSERH